jgi:hypothetical protein
MTIRTGNVAGDHHDWEKTSAQASDAPVHRTIAVTDEAAWTTNNATQPLNATADRCLPELDWPRRVVLEREPARVRAGGP